MRAKQQRLIVTFYTTADAMAMEQKCKLHSISGRLIPVPRDVSSDCGIAWSCEPELRGQIEAMTDAVGLEPAGYYEMLV